MHEWDKAKFEGDLAKKKLIWKSTGLMESAEKWIFNHWSLTDEILNAILCFKEQTQR